jgi:hypothetical protein
MKTFDNLQISWETGTILACNSNKDRRVPGFYPESGLFFLSLKKDKSLCVVEEND